MEQIKDLKTQDFGLSPNFVIGQNIKIFNPQTWHISPPI